MQRSDAPAKPTPVTSMSAEAMRFALYNRFLKGEAKIPQMPEAYLRIRRHLADPHASLEALAQTIKADPPLAAYLMQFADSPLLRGTRPGAPLRDVLARLGLRRLESLVTGFAVRNLYIGKESALQQVFRARWRAALERAAYSAALAQRCDRVEIDQALLGGLLQDVGSLPLLAELERWPQQSRERDSLNQLCEWLSGDIGVVIMTVWKLPTDLIECARQRTRWEREPAAGLDLADLVQVAHQLRDLQRDDDELTRLPAFNRLCALCPELALPASRLRETLADEFQLWRQLLGNR